MIELGRRCKSVFVGLAIVLLGIANPTGSYASGKDSQKGNGENRASPIVQPVTKVQEEGLTRLGLQMMPLDEITEKQPIKLVFSDAAFTALTRSLGTSDKSTSDKIDRLRKAR